MQAEIINIGDELLIGQVINTNASWMSEQLNLTGISICRISVISDKKQDIINSLKEAETRADVILITGGLGPTNDDVTKFTLSEYFKSPLILNEEVLKDIEIFFDKRGVPLSELNRKQAEVPENCTPIRNLNGTAPGMWFEKNNKIYISLPGVPFEMKAMISDFIIPNFRSHFQLPVIIHKTILTEGIGESFLSERIKDWENKLPEHIQLAYLPSPGIVRLRLSATGKNKNILEKEINNLVNQLQSIIPENIYGFDNDAIEEIIGQLLKEKYKTISTAESCTGGFIAHRITSVPGSSHYFIGSIISYSNEIKIRELNVPEETLIKYGAVSEETVTAMADGIRKKFKTDYSIAVSGIAGPDGGTAKKPVGTVWIAIATDEKMITKKYLFGDNRERNIQRTAIAALNMLRKTILLK